MRGSVVSTKVGFPTGRRVHRCEDAEVRVTRHRLHVPSFGQTQ